MSLAGLPVAAILYKSYGSEQIFIQDYKIIQNCYQALHDDVDLSKSSKDDACKEIVHDNIVYLSQMACFLLLPSLVILFSVFFMSIDKKYLGTFFSTLRAKDLSMKRFLNSELDEVKADAVFRNNRCYWKEIEDEVEQWARDNWKRWMEENPDWLDENMKSSIPTEMIPILEDRKEVKELQEKRRRSSLLGVELFNAKVQPEGV